MTTRVNGIEIDGGVDLSDATPQPLGVAAAGTSSDASRADHVHALPTIPALSSATPAALGVASAGVSAEASRADHVHAAPAGGVDTSLQAAPDTGWTAATGAGIGTAAIASGVATLTMTAAQTSARLRRTVAVCSPHAPAVEFMARLTQTIADGVHEQGIGLTNAAYTRGVRVQIDIYGNATLYHNVSGSWVSGAFLGSVTGWGAGTLWLRLVAANNFVHFYSGSGAGPTPPTSWTRIASYNLSGASPDFTAALGEGLTDLVLFANRAGGWITNECTARNIQWRSLLGAPT